MRKYKSVGDHGHTRNPVPFVAYGPREEFLRERVTSLADVTPAILAAYDEPLSSNRVTKLLTDYKSLILRTGRP